MQPLGDVGPVLYVLGLVGVVAFAVAGALRAIERDMDIFGVLVLALITALGGGIIRDILLNRLPVSLNAPIYFFLAVGGGLLTTVAIVPLTRYLFWLKVFDAIGLAVFSILGAQTGMSSGLNLLSVLLVGLLTGIGGGVLRDILANDVPLVFRQEVYALASLIGILIFWALARLGVVMAAAAVTGTVTIVFIRLAAIHWNLNLPRVRRH